MVFVVGVLASCQEPMPVSASDQLDDALEVQLLTASDDYISAQLASEVHEQFDIPEDQFVQFMKDDLLFYPDGRMAGARFTDIESHLDTYSDSDQFWTALGGATPRLPESGMASRDCGYRGMKPRGTGCRVNVNWICFGPCPPGNGEQ